MLKPNHVKALTLLRENKMSVKDIASACNLSENYLYHLMEGNMKEGNIAAEFHQEYKKVLKEISKRTASNIKTFKDNLIEELMEWNDSLPRGPKLNLHTVKAKREILAELNKATAGIEIGEMHLHSGLSGEDLFNEFKRLKSLVQLSANGRGVPEALKRRSRSVSVSPKRKKQGTEAAEADSVSPEPEAGDIPQE